MPTLVHFGAGAIGRALVGTLFSDAGWRIVFVDANPVVVAALRERGGYLVRVLESDERGGERHVAGATALASDDVDAVVRALAEAELWGSSVGAGVLPRLYPTLAAALVERRKIGGGPVSMLLCENWHHAGTHVRDGLRALMPKDFPLEERFGAVETCVGKMTPQPTPEMRAADPLAIGGEAFNRLIADASDVVGPRPELDGLDWVTHFEAWEDRKLYLHNFGHATLAYYADPAGYEYLAEAMKDAAVAGKVARAMGATETALARRYPEVFSEADLARHGRELRARFANRALGDTAYRVGRDLARKLAPGDRMLGALRLVEETGGDSTPVREAILESLSFAAHNDQGRRDEADEGFIARLKERGAAEAIRNASIDALEKLMEETGAPH